MAKLPPARKVLLESLSAEILHQYGRGRTIVAIDGPDGAGKTRFADDLASVVRTSGHPVFRASIDDFHRPRAERHVRGKDSPDGVYRDSFDYSALRRVLIEPFRLGGSTAFVTAIFDLGRDAQVEPKWLTGPDDAILIIDGIFLNRPELRGLWNYSVWLDVPAEIAEARLTGRDGGSSTSSRYSGGQAIYLEEADPRSAATAIIDNGDFEAPRRVFADRC